MSKYTILYLHEAAQVSGAENSLLNLVRMIDRNTFNPVFACPDTGPFASKISGSGVKVHPITFPAVRRMAGVASTVRRLCMIVEKEGVDLIHSNSIRTHIYAAITGKFKKIPVVWHQRNLLIDELADPDRILSFIPDRIICNSHAVAKRFVVNGRLPEKVIVIYNGVDTNIFRPRIDRGDIRRKLGIAAGEIVVGIASRFHPNKGHAVFFEAASILKASGLYCKFLVAGDAVFENTRYMEKRLRDIVAGLGIEDRVIFAGFREDMPEVYAAMDIFVLTSEIEACARVIIEAMSSGLPVVGTDSGGTPEIIQGAVTGFMIKPRDARALADKIAYLVNNPAVAKEMGATGRRRVEEHFSIEKNARQTESAYLEILKR